MGLESVRRDWPAVAGRLQEGLLERVFTARELLPFVRDLVAEVRAGDRDAELVYVKRIRKGSVDNYKASSPPHVQAARKLSGPGWDLPARKGWLSETRKERQAASIDLREQPSLRVPGGAGARGVGD